MTRTSAGAAIVAHIDELEGAMHFVSIAMTPRLGRATAAEIERCKVKFGWAGKVFADFDKDTWLAAENWRSADDPNDQQLCDLYLEFEGVPCADGRDPETWIAHYCGYAGSGIRFGFHTNLLNATEWKAVLRTRHDIVSELVAAGFTCDAKAGSLSYAISIDRTALSEAFEADDLDDALRPIGTALEEIRRARKPLDRLVAAIRAVKK